LNTVRADIQELGAQIVPAIEAQTRVLERIAALLEEKERERPVPMLLSAGKKVQIVYGPNELPITLIGEKE
jgi:hypothetical protein